MLINKGMTGGYKIPHSPLVGDVKLSKPLKPLAFCTNFALLGISANVLSKVNNDSSEA